MTDDMPDTTSYISQGWREKAKQGEISEELVRPIPMLDEMVKKGHLGRKSGKGFYDVSPVHCTADGYAQGCLILIGQYNK